MHTHTLSLKLDAAELAYRVFLNIAVADFFDRRAEKNSVSVIFFKFRATWRFPDFDFLTVRSF